MKKKLTHKEVSSRGGKASAKKSPSMSERAKKGLAVRWGKKKKGKA